MKIFNKMIEKDFESLVNISNLYEDFIIKKYENLSSFYREAYIDSEYEDFKSKITSKLNLIGSGKCASVYSTDECQYVVKLHNPYNEKLDLRSNPSKKVFEICKSKTAPDIETCYADPRAVKYFLCLDYITENGLAGVQRKADCSSEAQKKAYNLFGNIDPYLQKWNHVNNMGLLNGSPVYIDWF